ncbi:MAG: hypothetical protein QOH96_870 [Blastocatellia bacterium]|nr:hypothetical protein [Blastocatellia bacterium]
MPEASIKQPPERLRIFVSSTIAECAAERARVREAVVSLNHEPFLFEHAGARPYPPRTLYLRKLHESDIFVGIYKHSYGWIAPEAERSGLEDEYREATRRGMPCLLYVHSDHDSRDPRLTSLVKEFDQGDNTFFRYHTADELYTRVRDDVTSVIAGRFVPIRSVESIVAGNSSLGSSVVLSESYVARPQLERAILERLLTEPIVEVTGGPGSGKTILLLLLARNNGFEFISGGGAQPSELIQSINNRLRSLRSAEAEYFWNLDNAIAALEDELELHQKVTLVVDDLFDDEFRNRLSEVLKASGGTHRLVYSTSGIGNQLNSNACLVIPPLTEEEVGGVLSQSNLDANDLIPSRLLALSGGNPLLLRYALKTGVQAPLPTLVGIAVSGYSRLFPRTKEILAYLAISDARLSMEELLQLVTDGPGSPDVLLADLASAKEYIIESVFGFTLRHQHQRDAIMGVLQEHPQAHAYYARRVSRVLRQRGDNVLAFRVLDQVSDNDRIKIGYAAIFDLSRAHDFRSLRPVLTAMIRALGETADYEDTVRLYLGLSEAALVLGEPKESDEALHIAKKAAKESGDSTLIGFTHEMTVWHSAMKRWDASSIQALHELRNTYRDEGDPWSFGRMALEISALYIRMDRFEDAVAEAKESIAAFSQVGDAYGESLAMLNLASSLSGLPGRERELEALLNEIRKLQRTNPTRRLRAWFANLMVRRLRREKKFESAKRYAHEAIQIGNDLGELHLVALNRINLGNVLRDEKLLQDARKEYEAASALANKLGEVGTEASAERLISGLHFSLEETGLALQHASYAVALLQDSVASSEGAECLEQLADVQMKLNSHSEARGNYLKACALYETLNDHEEQWRIGEYLLRVLAKADLRMEYCRAIDSLTGVVTEASSDADQVWPEQLYERLGALIGAVPEAHMIGVLGKCFQVLLAQLVDPVARFLFVELSESIVSRSVGLDEEWRTVLPLLSLLTAKPARLIYLEDLQYLAVELERHIHGVHIKPDGNGAPTWTIVCDFKSPVICSLNGFDESKETALVIVLLVIFFKGFGRTIQKEIIGDTRLMRREIMISVGNERLIPVSIRSFLEPTMKDADSCVSRPTNPKEEHALPTNVFFREAIVEDWAPGTGQASKLHVLLGQTLLEVIFQLFGGEIDDEVLRPKLLNVIRETVA